MTSQDTAAHTDPRFDNTRGIRSPHGTELTCKSWLPEAP